MDNVEAQRERNLPFLLAAVVRHFWSGIHDLPYAFYRELITQITEIPQYGCSPQMGINIQRGILDCFPSVFIFLFLRREKKC